MNVSVTRNVSAFPSVRTDMAVCLRTPRFAEKTSAGTNSAALPVKWGRHLAGCAVYVTDCTYRYAQQVAGSQSQSVGRISKAEPEKVS
jgi:hypothetical protein